MRSDIKHILHAREFLAPGGVLGALCMAGRHREEQLRTLAATWEPLPPKSFKAEGTKIDAIFLTIEG